MAHPRNVNGRLTHRARLVVDARMIADGGIGTYLSELLPRLAASRPEWHFTLLGSRDALAEIGRAGNVSVRHASSPIYGVREQIELPLLAPSGADLFWSPHYNIPLLARAKLVVTIHDVAHLALADEDGALARSAYAMAMFHTIQRRAVALLVDSQFSLDEFVKHVAPPRCPAAVTHLGASDAWMRARETHPERPLAEPYLVYVGNFKRHKNVPLLLRAFGRARARVPHRLMLIGRSEGLRADPAIPAALAELGDAVRATGEIPAAEIHRWVAHADALVTTSRYEGFGLPPLEAMVAGVPVLASRAGSLPEICGDAALYCDPDDETGVASQLVEILTEPGLRARLVIQGRERARGFTWERCAEATAGVLERALTS